MKDGWLGGVLAIGWAVVIYVVAAGCLYLVFWAIAHYVFGLHSSGFGR